MLLRLKAEIMNKAKETEEAEFNCRHIGEY